MKYLSVIILGFLLVASSAARADEPPPEPTGIVTLLCKMSRNAQQLTQTLSIDYDKKLVDGISANFSPSIISWTVENGSKTERYELNRVTGSYYYWIGDEPSADPMQAYTCEIAPKKF